MKTRTTQITIVPNGEPLYSEMAFRVSIEDEAGEYVTVRSNLGNLPNGTIAIDPAEWPALRDAIDRMVGECGG